MEHKKRWSANIHGKYIESLLPSDEVYRQRGSGERLRELSPGIIELFVARFQGDYPTAKAMCNEERVKKVWMARDKREAQIPQALKEQYRSEAEAKEQAREAQRRRIEAKRTALVTRGQELLRSIEDLLSARVIYEPVAKDRAESAFADADNVMDKLSSHIYADDESGRRCLQVYESLKD
jgi:hypothetical protein